MIELMKALEKETPPCDEEWRAMAPAREYYTRAANRLKTEKGTSVAEAFGLTPGAQSMPFGDRQNQRNALLAEALDLCSAKKHWPACEELAGFVKQFEKSIWPRIRGESELPEKYPKIIHLIFQAMALQSENFPAELPRRFPGSAQGIHDAVKKSKKGFEQLG